jgi:hypothetical protein
MLTGNSAFFGDIFDGIFPLTLSATLWLPEAVYTNITTDPAGDGPYQADVRAALIPYSEGMATNRIGH